MIPDRLFIVAFVILVLIVIIIILVVPNSDAIRRSDERLDERLDDEITPDKTHLIVEEWARHLMDTIWGIQIDDSKWDTGSTNNRIQTSFLNQILNNPVKSLVREDMNMYIRLQKFVKWTAMPMEINGRHTYNPTMTSDGRMFARNDDLENMMSGLCYYITTTTNRVDDHIVIDPNYEKVKFMYDGNPMNVANKRDDITEEICVIEDLRAIPRFSTGRPELLTGVGLFMKNNKLYSKCVVFEYRGGNTLHLLCFVESPTDRKIEKNWLFVENDEVGEYTVFYQVEPMSVFSWKLGNTLLTNRQDIPFRIPSQWKETFRPESTNIRLSSMTLLQNEETGRPEYMCVMHKKDADTLYYSYFCMYLDALTLDIIAYIPNPILVDVAVKIFFVMNIVPLGDFYHVMIGVSDEIAGIRTYRRWDESRVSFIDNIVNQDYDEKLFIVEHTEHPPEVPY